MSLYWFLLIVSAFACGSVPPADIPLRQCLLAPAMLVLGWSILAMVTARLGAARVRGGLDPLAGAIDLERNLERMRWIGLVVAVVCLTSMGLGAAVQTWPIFSASMSLQGVVLLQPALWITMATLAAEHHYGVLLGYAPRGLAAAFGDVASAMRQSIGWLIAPIFALLLLHDVIALLPLGPSVGGGLSLVVILLAVPVLVPLGITRIWTTQPLDPVDARWIEPVVAHCGLAELPIRKWDTRQQAYNAVVIGFLPRLRTLLITDRLLGNLDRASVIMVVLHEVAHLQRWHIWIRILSVLPAWGLAALLSHLLGTHPWSGLICVTVAIGVMLLLLGWSAHRTEFDADATACRLAIALPPEMGGPTTADEAAQTLAHALRRVTQTSDSCSRSTWLHPSVAERCDRLRQWSARHSSPVTACLGGGN